MCWFGELIPEGGCQWAPGEVTRQAMFFLWLSVVPANLVCFLSSSLASWEHKT